MRTVFLLLVFLSVQTLSSQKKSRQEIEYTIISHEVRLGETVRMISQKYLVPPADIYKLNKFAVEGVSQGMVLQVPVPKKDESDRGKTKSKKKTPLKINEEPKQIIHLAEAGETVSQIAKKYGVTSADINEVNPELESTGFRPGDKIIIPSGNGLIPSNTEAAASVVNSKSKSLFHEVASGETLSGIAKKYKVSVQAIEQQNQKILERGLQPGQLIKIKSE